MNGFQLSAQLISREALRYTLAGVAVCECGFQHTGVTQEADSDRKNNFKFTAVALGKIGEVLSKEELGSQLILRGFVATSSVRSSKLVLHITEYDKGV